ncbi:MAG TPA: radical SAM protein, partial [Thermotoga sp.]|nr:radical SAM protein [Thermotoga sp.]
MKKASFWKTLKDGRVMCLLCPNHCILKDHQCGICLSRVNLNGVLYTRNYGEITIMRKDTMNQRLLYFKPDIKTISIGSWGCNLACNWCYNWEISRYRPDHLIKKISPVTLVRMLNDTKAIVFTYNEPITWYEYIMDVCKLLSRDVDIILNTNAYVEREPWQELLNYVTALNVDLKAFSPFKY